MSMSPRWHLIVDFDGTITQSDTIAELVRSAIQRHPTATRPRLASAWHDAQTRYLAALSAHSAKYRPSEPQRTTPAHEEAFLADLKPIEEASLSRVSHSGIFDALPPRILHEMGAEAVLEGRIALRPGWDRLLVRAAAADVPLTVLSVHWSRSFIQGVLSRGAPPLEVVANEIAEGGRIVGPGSASARLTTAADKMAEMRRRAVAADVVYLGDSPTDLTCLLGARRGVVLVPGGEPASPLLDSLRRIGVGVAHVGEMASWAATTCAETEEKVVFWARDMDEVLRSGVLGI
ncbi:hypothetical protein E4U42_000250 [Claviceps africana]|uniref:Uncharacterized protein n=1 Tax=Claviceps africana TaxID=83212 RepID=A0A8K0JA49_9HYPO|nr:hypothetical protein E4U42_000250 [Claviceps africana]